MKKVKKRLETKKKSASMISPSEEHGAEEEELSKYHGYVIDLFQRIKKKNSNILTS